MKKDDRFYLYRALKLARAAFRQGFSPVGAVLCNGDGTVLAEAESQREIGNVFHAEFRALYAFQQNKPDLWCGITLYSTLEPCLMCCGMAAVLRVKSVKWLVSDVWAGTRLLNYNMPYVQQRFPTMDKIHLGVTDLHQEALDMWVKYLRDTGHADAVSFMLGLSEDYQCKLS